MNKLDKAIKMLKNKCDVIPEKYALYNGAYLFVAYQSNVKDKSKIINPYYLVDIKTKSVGPFSPAFDFEGFFKALEHMKSL